MGNILDMVFLIKNDENLILVGPPPLSLSKINFPINYLGGGGGGGYHILVTRVSRVRRM